MGENNQIFWSGKRSGFGEPDGTPPLGIPKSNPPPWGAGEVKHKN